MQPDTERISLLQAALRTAGLDAFVCASPSEVLLLTGFWPVMGDSVAVFTSDGSMRLIVPGDEEEIARKMSAADIVTYTPEMLSEITSPKEQLKAPLVEVRRSLGLTHARLGVVRELGVQPASYVVETQFRGTMEELLREALPEAQIEAADDLLEQQKALKSDRELRRMRVAAQVAAAGFQAAQQVIRAGLREAEVAAQAQAAFESTEKAQRLTRSYGQFFCMSGPNSATASAAFAHTRQRVLEEGDLVMIHANTCGDGMWTDITRTYTVGAPVQRHEEMRNAILEARAAALKTIAPGIKTAEVDHAARSVMEAHGFGKAFRHATGHGVGFAAANANAHPRIHPSSKATLERTMTFNVEPAAYFDGYGGMRHCDVVAVGEHEAEVFTGF